MRAKTVNEYILNAPEDIRNRLSSLRKIIKEAAPDAVEKISYSMPFYEYKGRLAYFAFYKKHIGLYIPPPIIENHRSELKKYKTSKSAVQIPMDNPLPINLIKKLVKARVEWNNSLLTLKKSSSKV